ncbi:MAG TPA: cupredoxin family protein [Rhodocyclaceae bacterium]|nr:cupredoxin family protein [Rhodocyclaceae bacterium]
MKKTLPILLLTLFSSLAIAGGDHAGGHDMHGDHGAQGGHDMSAMHGDEHGGHATNAGRPGDPAKVSRTIELVMDDSMRYSPSEITVKAGETVRFFVKNSGKMKHEIVIGTVGELKAHAEMMRKMPEMEHAEPNMLTLGPGQRGGLVWQFERPGTVDFACLIPGHMEAGMVGKVAVK